MKYLWPILCFGLFSLAKASRRFDFERAKYDFFRREIQRECEKVLLSCNECRSIPYCSWCSDGMSAKCSSSLECPKESTIDECSVIQPTTDTTIRDESILMKYFDIPSSSGNLNDIIPCGRRGNCSSCTSSDSCSWCAKSKTCFSFFGSNNATRECGSVLWYRNQCLYSSNVEPCHQRTGGCKECTKDDVCYWCESTGNCSYYPHDAYVPSDCAAHHWYYTSCSKMSFWVVLIPIMVIILAPVLIFIIIGIVLWCMKKFGKADPDGEEDDESDEEPLPEKKKPHKMTMSHKPEPSRVEELRKKYNLKD